MIEDQCDFPRCRAEGAINYLGKNLCDHHWQLIDTDEEYLLIKIKLKKPIKKPRKKKTSCTGSVSESDS